MTNNAKYPKPPYIEEETHSMLEAIEMRLKELNEKLKRVEGTKDEASVRSSIASNLQLIKNINSEGEVWN